MAPAVCGHTHVHATHTNRHPLERNAVVTVSACSFLSLVYLCMSLKSNNEREEETPFQCHPSCTAAVGPTPEKRRSSVGTMLW